MTQITYPTEWHESKVRERLSEDIPDMTYDEVVEKIYSSIISELEKEYWTETILLRYANFVIDLEDIFENIIPALNLVTAVETVTCLDDEENTSVFLDDDTEDYVVHLADGFAVVQTKTFEGAFHLGSGTSWKECQVSEDNKRFTSITIIFDVETDKKYKIMDESRLLVDISNRVVDIPVVKDMINRCPKIGEILEYENITENSFIYCGWRYIVEGDTYTLNELWNNGNVHHQYTYSRDDLPDIDIGCLIERSFDPSGNAYHEAYYNDFGDLHHVEIPAYWYQGRYEYYLNGEKLTLEEWEVERKKYV